MSLPIFAFFSDHEVAGKLTLKHIYEIAKIKAEDYNNSLFTLEQICQNLIYSAKTCGIQIVRDLDEQEFIEFREERVRIMEQQEKEIQEAKEAKMLRAV